MFEPRDDEPSTTGDVINSAGATPFDGTTRGSAAGRTTTSANLSARSRRLVSLAVAASTTAALMGVGLAVHTSAAAAAPRTAGVATTAAQNDSQHTVRTLRPTADSFTSSRDGQGHFGRLLHLAVGTTAHHNVHRTYLRFDIPGSMSVVSAHLQLTRFGAWRPQPVSARMTAPTGWGERTIDARNAPKISRWLDTGSVRSGGHVVSLDVTRAFQYRRKATIAVIAPRVHGLTQFASIQAPRLRPVLRVVLARHLRTPQGGPTGEPTPEPTTSAPTTEPTTPEPTTSSPVPTTTSPAPTTTSPAPTSSSPSEPTSSSSSSGPCTVSAILVPSCGDWLGVAPEAYTYGQPLATTVAYEENNAGRQMDIVHRYHVNGDLFPNAQERAIAEQPGHNRLLLINWKPSTSKTWAQVAAGAADSTIDAEAAYIKANFPYKFFLTIYHEPEDNVNENPSSGMTATDYAAMYRHVVLRLRADGVTNAVTVMNYMGFSKWAQQSWFDQLWPGSDVVDWIGLDPYGTGGTSGAARTLGRLVNNPAGSFTGYYNWATTEHPGTPIMLSEWGVKYDATNPTGQASFFESVTAEAAQYPALKALVYFDVPTPPNGIKWTSMIQNPVAAAAYAAMCNSAPFDAPDPVYGPGGNLNN